MYISAYLKAYTYRICGFYNLYRRMKRKIER